MVHREIIALCTQFHRKLINTLCVQNEEILNENLAVYTETTGL